MDFTLQADTVVEAPPEHVFDRLTDIEHLPDWNREIPRVVESPLALEVGSEWVVTIHAMKTHWDSRSRVVELDRDAGRFAYRSQTDDGNPSFVDWRWDVRAHPDGGGAHVAVRVDVNPRTFLRRRLLSELRRPSLRRAVERSLATLREQASIH